ncbi:MAG: chemotaxis protein CheB [Acidobacteriaceae bacterium]|nr:chemotaxis protein CheB [Acidobacteriaceae bacterium]
MYATIHCYAGNWAGVALIACCMETAVWQIEHFREYRAFDVVVIASSAGGISALGSFLSGLPAYFSVPVVIAQHLGPRKTYESRLDRVLQLSTPLHVKWADDCETLAGGKVYLAPQDGMTTIDPCDGTLRTLRHTGLPRSTPKANPLFKSAAGFYGNRTLALVLSGALKDGAQGATEISRVGGRVLVQSCSSAQFADMPRAAEQETHVALAFDPCALAHAVIALAIAPGASEWFRVENNRHWSAADSAPTGLSVTARTRINKTSSPAPSASALLRSFGS